MSELPIARPRSATPADSESIPPAKKARLDPIPPLDSMEVELDPEIQPSGSQSHLEPQPQPQKKKGKPRKWRRPPPPEAGTSEDVILRDVLELIGGDEVAQELKKDNKDYASPLTKGQEMELIVDALSSNGEGLCRVPSSTPPWVVVVPFCLPGETVKVRVYANARLHSLADLVSVVKPNTEMRNDELVRCRYFGTCAGCQYQMLPYETQLQLKQRVVEKAYKNFFTLPQSLLPPVQPTIASPKTYGYRTKITPHFDIPNTKGKAKATIDLRTIEIGFGEKGRRRVMDIEECVIATPVLNAALPGIREGVRSKIHTYKRGATLLLRDSFPRPAASDLPSSSSTVTADEDSDSNNHVCITDYKALVRERIGTTTFDFPAGSFFQNNNSVLLPLVHYVRDAIFTSPSNKPTHLVDTYCGAGFFGISLAPHFNHVAGVEISAESIASARINAGLNNLPSSPGSSITFTAGKSEEIFASVAHFPPEHTVVIIDPPRKGCDAAFLEQVVKFSPRMLVYVSCNVHTQARDVGMLIGMMEGEGKTGRYRVDSLRGFDLFPQTAHVESVAVLTLVDNA